MPPQVHHKWGHLRFLRRRTAYEWSAECPRCGSFGHDPQAGEPDRFRIRLDGEPRGFCRRCRFFSFVDCHVSAEERFRYSLERQLYVAKQQEQLTDRLKRLQDKAEWVKWHDALDPSSRLLWEKEGIPTSVQDYFQLGYSPEHTFWKGDTSFQSPALTIPYFREEWGRAVNVQYRLLSPIIPNDKYRFTPGLKSGLYFTEPARPKGKCLLVEGCKKAIVSYINLPTGTINSVVASPSKAVPLSAVDDLDQVEVIYLALDPDTADESDGSTRRAIEILNPERVRIVSLPAKPDDMLVKHHATGQDLWRFIRGAKRPTHVHNTTKKIPGVPFLASS